MAYTAAYAGSRWGELAALTHDQIDQDGRIITIDRKIIEIGGTLHLEPPKGRKKRPTIYPNHTPGGYPLAQRLTHPVEASPAGPPRPPQRPGTPLPPPHLLP